MHRFADAEAAYKEAAGIERELAAQNPTAYRPDLATTLDNLGVLFRVTHRFADAEVAYKEATDIDRELAAQNPAAYRPNLALTLNNLGVLYGDMRRFADAEAAYQESAGIRRELAAQNPRRLPARPGADAQQPGRSVPATRTASPTPRPP